MTETNNKILVVEDEPFLASMYATKLKLENFQVDVAADGEQALEKTDAEKYAVILMDIMMPKLNGFEALKMIRKDAKKANAHTPIIMLSNLGQKSDIEQGLLLGANDYIVKASFTPLEVLEKIKKYLVKEPSK